MDLILMRHGKAELRSDAKPDFERELTSIGRKKIKQAARGLACSLYKGRDVQIWTSPAVRTLQTAELLRLAFGNGYILVCDHFESGDAFLQAFSISSIEASGFATRTLLVMLSWNSCVSCVI